MARQPIRRMEVYEYLCIYKEENDGNAPTYEEITMHFGWASLNNAWMHVGGLERDGLVRLDERRRIVLIGGEYTAPENA